MMVLIRALRPSSKDLTGLGGAKAVRSTAGRGRDRISHAGRSSATTSSQAGVSSRGNKGNPARPKPAP
jgi:hypothetical protein